MKKNNRIWFYPLNLTLIFLMFLSISFKLVGQESFATVKDIDGNIYKTVRIGSQTWMAENLKTSRYNYGTPIPLVTDDIKWKNLSSHGYCWCDNDIPTNKNTYGALYNWIAVNNGKLCPIGWHVPTDTEWGILISNLGGFKVAGGKLKETGTTHWNSPNTGATNETGFTALPGGCRYDNGAHSIVGDNGYWWSATRNSATHALSRYMFYNGSNVNRLTANKNSGFSVRCLKDE